MADRANDVKKDDPDRVEGGYEFGQCPDCKEPLVWAPYDTRPRVRYRGKRYCCNCDVFFRIMADEKLVKVRGVSQHE